MPAIATTLKGLIWAAVAVATLLPARAQAPAESVSFAGKQIKLLIGFSPVSYGYDTYGRLLARYLPKYLPGNPTIIVLHALLGTKLKAVGGYPGSNEILLAVMRGELDGIVGYSWGVARSGHKDLLESGQLKIILQLGLEKHRELAHVPLVTEFVTKYEDLRVLEMFFSRQAMGRPVVAPPGLDARAARALRKAFADAMHDPQFVAESVRMGLEINFHGAAEVQGLVEKLYKSPHNVVARARAIAAPN